MLSLTAIEVITLENLHLYLEHSAVLMLCASIQFNAIALIKVDFPEALDPVKIIFLSITIEFLTGSSINGW